MNKDTADQTKKGNYCLCECMHKDSSNAILFFKKKSPYLLEIPSEIFTDEMMPSLGFASK